MNIVTLNMTRLVLSILKKNHATFRRQIFLRRSTYYVNKYTLAMKCLLYNFIFFSKNIEKQF